MRWSTCRRISWLLLCETACITCFEDVRGSGADEIADGVGSESVIGGSDRLVEDRKRIAHRSVAGFREQCEGVIVRLDFFAGDEIAKLADDIVELDGAKTEMLAAGTDRLRNIFRLRGGQHEDDVVGRLFQCLE